MYNQNNLTNRKKGYIIKSNSFSFTLNFMRHYYAFMHMYADAKNYIFFGNGSIEAYK